MPPLTHQRDFRVRFYECDVYGHVNYSNYLRYMQEAAFDASAARPVFRHNCSKILGPISAR